MPLSWCRCRSSMAMTAGDTILVSILLWTRLTVPIICIRLLSINATKRVWLFFLMLFTTMPVVRILLPVCIGIPKITVRQPITLGLMWKNLIPTVSFMISIMTRLWYVHLWNGAWSSCWRNIASMAFVSTWQRALHKTAVRRPLPEIMTLRVLPSWKIITRQFVRWIRRQSSSWSISVTKKRRANWPKKACNFGVTWTMLIASRQWGIRQTVILHHWLLSEQQCPTEGGLALWKAMTKSGQPLSRLLMARDL